MIRFKNIVENILKNLPFATGKDVVSINYDRTGRMDLGGPSCYPMSAVADAECQ